MSSEILPWKRKALLSEDIVRLRRNVEAAPGVSATHLDHSMVPYVRKSFYKHFKDGLKYLEPDDDFKISEPSEVSIDDDLYASHGNAYKYALDMTNKEVNQAVEGMFHNLNY